MVGLRLVTLLVAAAALESSSSRARVLQMSGNDGEDTGKDSDTAVDSSAAADAANTTSIETSDVETNATSTNADSGDSADDAASAEATDDDDEGEGVSFGDDEGEDEAEDEKEEGGPGGPSDEARDESELTPDELDDTVDLGNYKCWFEQGGEAFTSYTQLEDGLLGDEGNKRGDRTPVYDRGTRPEVWLDGDLTGTATTVSHVFELLDFSLNERTNSWDFIGEARVSWVDQRLAFNTSAGCPRAIWHLSKSHMYKIWHPYIYLRNQIKTSKVDPFTSAIEVSGDGTVVFRYHSYGTAHCKMSFRDMPFDKQTCDFIYQSLTYDSHELNFDRDASVVLYNTNTDKNLRTIAWVIEEAKTSIVGSEYEQLVAPERVAISVLPVLIMRTLLNQVYASIQSLPYYNMLTAYLTMLQYCGVLCVFEYAAVQYFLANEAAAHGRLRELRKFKDLLADDGDAERGAARDDVALVEAAAEPGGAAGAGAGAATRTLFKRKLEEHGVVSKRALFARKPTAPPGSYRRLLKSDSRENPAAKHALEALHDAFLVADADHSGAIAPDELSRVLREFGVFETPKAARLALSNYRFHRGRGDDRDALTFPEFAPFLVSYEDYRLANISAATKRCTPLKWVRYHPRSLQLDIFCRAFFIPITAVLVYVAIVMTDASD
ncbi:GABA-A receptor [Aureococcus anophagefferens]|nr:GABA-A receptor [Aureococcus anophagefferens]